MARMTKEEKDKLFGKLQISRRRIENGARTKPIFEAWQNYQRLSPADKYKITKEWEDYYKAVQTTNIYLIFQEQRKALAERNYPRVRELALEARSMRENNLIPEIAKPKSIDPAEFEHGIVISAWKDLDKRIKELSDYNINDIEEEKEVWD